MPFAGAAKGDFFENEENRGWAYGLGNAEYYSLSTKQEDKGNMKAGKAHCSDATEIGEPALNGKEAYATYRNKTGCHKTLNAC